MHRFFANTDQLVENNIEILGRDVKHIKDVLRLKPKEQIEVVIDGYVYLCEIIHWKRIKSQAKLLKTQRYNESPIHIVLYQGLAKGIKWIQLYKNVRK